MKNRDNEKYIPKIYTKTLGEYEFRVLGLDPHDERPLRVFCHNRGPQMCIHATRLSISSQGLMPTVVVEDDAIARQNFDLGGYYLKPELSGL
jgi:hypothetical protein